MLRSGITAPEIQVKDILGDLEKVINKIRLSGHKLKKVVFLGDLKHYFTYEKSEKFNFNKILDFLKNYVKEENIVLIKGNHDKFDFVGKKMRNYYFNGGIMFLHGHMNFPQIFEPRVKMIVMGHLHPAIILSDKQNIKREKYRCFLIGKYKGKEVIVVPSFPDLVRGLALNHPSYKIANVFRKAKSISNKSISRDFSIVPFQFLGNFKVHMIGDNGEIFEFGKLKDVK